MQTYTPNVTLQRISKGNLSVVEKGLTFKICNEATKLIHLKKNEGEETIEHTLALMLINLQEQINVTRPLAPHQITMLAADIIELYPYESLEDFVLCFKMARQNKLSPHYNSIDSVMINKWMGEYLELKAVQRENDAHKKEIEVLKETKEPSPILEKVKADIEQKMEESRRRTANFKVMTFEEHESYLTTIISELDAQKYDDKQTLEHLRIDLNNNNSAYSGVYDKLIESIDLKLKP